MATEVPGMAARGEGFDEARRVDEPHGDPRAQPAGPTRDGIARAIDLGARASVVTVPL